MWYRYLVAWVGILWRDRQNNRYRVSSRVDWLELKILPWNCTLIATFGRIRVQRVTLVCLLEVYPSVIFFFVLVFVMYRYGVPWCVDQSSSWYLSFYVCLTCPEVQWSAHLLTAHSSTIPFFSPPEFPKSQRKVLLQIEALAHHDVSQSTCCRSVNSLAALCLSKATTLALEVGEVFCVEGLVVDYFCVNENSIWVNSLLHCSTRLEAWANGTSWLLLWVSCAVTPWFINKSYSALTAVQTCINLFLYYFISRPPNIQTLIGPEQHTVHCLVDVPGSFNLPLKFSCLPARRDCMPVVGIWMTRYQGSRHWLA
jgi:hypothetical protein